MCFQQFQKNLLLELRKYLNDPDVSLLVDVAGVSSVVLVVLIVDESVSEVEDAVEVLVADSVLVSVVSDVLLV